MRAAVVIELYLTHVARSLKSMCSEVVHLYYRHCRLTVSVGLKCTLQGVFLLILPGMKFCNGHFQTLHEVNTEMSGENFTNSKFLSLESWAGIGQLI